ncbi:MAG: hypothetical protein J7L23_02825 [Candidatus Diapherotrites archaeon]|nr:hypothetical protein [Candidatus Diapherotrites archaeon]
MSYGDTLTKRMLAGQVSGRQKTPQPQTKRQSHRMEMPFLYALFFMVAFYFLTKDLAVSIIIPLAMWLFLKYKG